LLKIHKTKIYLIFLLFFIASLLIYAQGLRCDFILDDNPLIVENPYIKTPALFSNIWTKHIYQFSASKNSDYYRPLLLMTFAADYAIWKLNPIGFRLTNILLHAINSTLVFILTALLAQNFLLGLAAASLFCIHPIHLSAVTFIAGRADLLVTFFILLSCIFFIKYLNGQKLTQRLTPYAASLFCFLLAIGSKENSLIMPLLIMLLTIKASKLSKNSLLATAGFWLIALFFLLNRPYLVHNVFASAPREGLFWPIPLEGINTVSVLKNYFILFLFPSLTIIMRTTPFVSSLTLADILFLITLICLFYISAKKIQRIKDMFAFGFLWFFICLLPLPMLLHSFPTLGVTMAEHWLYLPSIGLFWIAGSLLEPFSTKRKVIFAGLIIFYGALAAANDHAWKDPITILDQSLKHNPKNDRLSLELGNTYYKKGLYDKALDLFWKTLAQNPNQCSAYNQIGNIYREGGQLNKALDFYNRSIKVCPKNEIPYANIGLIYEAQNKHKEALDAYLHGLTIEPNSWLIFHNIGMWFLNKKIYAQSIIAFQKSVVLNPDNNNARIGMGMAFFGLNSKKEAERSLREALHLQPNSFMNLKNIAAVYGNNGELDKAIQLWAMALKLKPGDEEMKNNILHAQKVKK